MVRGTRQHTKEFGPQKIGPGVVIFAYDVFSLTPPPREAPLLPLNPGTRKFVARRKRATGAQAHGCAVAPSVDRRSANHGSVRPPPGTHPHPRAGGRGDGPRAAGAGEGGGRREAHTTDRHRANRRRMAPSARASPSACGRGDGRRAAGNGTGRRHRTAGRALRQPEPADFGGREAIHEGAGGSPMWRLRCRTGEVTQQVTAKGSVDSLMVTLQ